jgi:hypothetical protein
MSGRACANCVHFGAAPRYIESRFPGLTALGSGYAAVRAHDGLCALHDRYIGASSVCGAHAASTSTRQS